MIYVKDTTDLFQITEEINKNSWIYSQDGQELKFATGFLQKTKVVFLSIWNLTWFFGKLKDQAILNLFPDEIQPFILEIEKIQKSTSQTFSIIQDIESERPFNPRLVCDFSKIKEIIESSPALEIANSIDRTFIEHKFTQTYTKNNSLMFKLNTDKYMTEDKLKLLEKTSFIFRSAFIANKYFTSEIFGKVEVDLFQALNLGKVWYTGRLKNGQPAGEGKIETTLPPDTTTLVIATGEFVYDDSCRAAKIWNGNIEYNYSDAEKSTIIYKNGEETNRFFGHSHTKRAVS